MLGYPSGRSSTRNVHISNLKVGVLTFLSINFREEHKKMYTQMQEKMKTPEGIREVVANTLWGKGHAKCRKCNTIIEYDISNQDVYVEKKVIKLKGSRSMKGHQGYRFVIACPGGDGQIDLGEFYPAGGLERGNPGDQYFPKGYAKGYLNDLCDAYRIIGEENVKSKQELGKGFLDKNKKISPSNNNL